MFSQSFDRMTEKQKITSFQEYILRRLEFLTMLDREQEIVHAHSATFNWIYASDRKQPWDNFKYWLQTGNGVYWVTGKAGSGKSTLMRYLTQNEETREHLQRWAESVHLVTASFYFWNVGTPMQKSQMGLLQSLLFKTLDQCPNLIPQVFPHRWRSYETFCNNTHPWTRTELMGGFKALLKHTGASAKFCFFVDGLDEYDGDHHDIVDLLKVVASSTNVKICLSSRPLLAFEDGFVKFPKLRLHDLTHGDIVLYTDSQLGRNERFIALKKREPERAPQLVQEIVDKSAGVFLWVTLVVKSLLEGLQNSDRISDLQKRLRQLPADLEDLYFVMIGNLEPFYEQQASHIFQIVHAARQPLSVLAVSFADEEDPEFAVLAEMRRMDHDQIVLRAEDTVRRLNSRCKGLLEVRNGSSVDWPDSKVEFLHRTVKDFLETPNVRERILSQSASNFDVNISLMQSYLLQLKAIYGSRWTEQTFRLFTGEFMEFAARAESKPGDMQLSLLDCLFKTATRLWQVRPDGGSKSKRLGEVEDQHAWVKIVPPHRHVVDFLSLAASFGLHLYVEHNLAQVASFRIPQLSRSILYFAVVPAPLDQSPRRPNTKLVSFLLESGADPNLSYGGSCVWQYILKYIYGNFRQLKVGEHQELLVSMIEVTRLLIEAGANPEACIPWGDYRTIPAIAVVEKTFQWLLPEQSIELQLLIRRKLVEKVGRERAQDIERGWELRRREVEDRELIHVNNKAGNVRDRLVRDVQTSPVRDAGPEKNLAGPSKLDKNKSSGKWKKPRSSGGFRKLKFWT